MEPEGEHAIKCITLLPSDEEWRNRTRKRNVLVPTSSAVHAFLSSLIHVKCIGNAFNLLNITIKVKPIECRKINLMLGSFYQYLFHGL